MGEALGPGLASPVATYPRLILFHPSGMMAVSFILEVALWAKTGTIMRRLSRRLCCWTTSELWYSGDTIAERSYCDIKSGCGRAGGIGMAWPISESGMKVLR